MGNIMVNEVCNLSCPYCFADKYVNRGNSTDISYINFKKAVDWINGSWVEGEEPERIAIIGGEPLLHENLNDLLSYAISQRRQDQEIMIFTNGILLEDYASFFAKNDINLLINLNSPEDMGEDNFLKVRSGISELRKRGADFSVGVNLYDADEKYDFLIELVREFMLKSVRLGLICPNTSGRKEGGTRSYFEEISPSLFALIERLAREGCSSHLDCQKLPRCYAEGEIEKVERLEDRYGVNIDIFDNASCNPVIDILPDLSIVRCFGMSGREFSYPMSSFNTTSDAEMFFVNQFDNLMRYIPSDARCVETECEEMYLGKCQGGCLAYKASRLMKLREALNEAFSKEVRIAAE